MNLLLTAPLPTSTSLRDEYDNKVLWVFLILMLTMITLGLLFVNLVSANVEAPYTTNNPPAPHFSHRYV